VSAAMIDSLVANCAYHMMSDVQLVVVEENLHMSQRTLVVNFALIDHKDLLSFEL